MTRSELNSLIERRKKELDSDYVFIPQYYPLSDFCKNHFISKPEDFIGYDMKYLLKVLYFSQTLNPNPSEKEAERIVDRIVYPIVSGMDYQSLSHTIYISEIIADSGEGEKVVRYLKEKSSIKSKIMSFDLKLREDIIDNLTSLKSHADSINFPIRRIIFITCATSWDCNIDLWSGTIATSPTKKIITISCRNW